MTKLTEYRKLNKKVRMARSSLHAAQFKITKRIETIEWSKSGQSVACINRYFGMSMPLLARGTFENIEFVKYCDLLDCYHLCENNDCPYQEKNWDVVAAQFAYDNARQERRAFVRGLFRRRTK